MDEPVDEEMDDVEDDVDSILRGLRSDSIVTTDNYKMITENTLHHRTTKTLRFDQTDLDTAMRWLTSTQFIVKQNAAVDL